MNRYLSLAEVAALDGVSMSTFKRIVKSGEGPRLTRISQRRWGIRQSDYESHCAARAVRGAV